MHRSWTAERVLIVVPPLVGSSVGFYLGAGPGLYHWGFDRGSGAVGTRLGVHGLVGVEYSMAGERFVVGYEAQLHAVRGPTSAHVPQLLAPRLVQRARTYVVDPAVRFFTLAR